MAANFELVTVCRSSNPVAFLRSESDQCRDLSATTARNIAITRVKASPIGTTEAGSSTSARVVGVKPFEKLCGNYGQRDYVWSRILRWVDLHLNVLERIISPEVPPNVVPSG